MNALSGFTTGFGEVWLLSSRTSDARRTSSHVSPRLPRDRLCFLHTIHPHCHTRQSKKTRVCATAEVGTNADGDDKWFALLPESTSALYMCSLPSIEAWLRSLGFRQSSVRPEIWTVERDDWHAELSMDVTDVSIR